MPIGSFEWDCEGEYIFIVEVDLAYPSEFHTEHQDVLLTPEELVIQSDWLSEYCSDFNEKMNEDVSTLVETIFDKKNYICHIQNLQFYIQNGIQFVKIHKALKFKQSIWIPSYREKNTVMQEQAKSPFEQIFYKLMSNACFGKTMVNKRNHRNDQFATNKQEAMKFTSQPNYKSLQIISENLCSVSLSQHKIFWDKPTQVGWLS